MPGSILLYCGIAIELSAVLIASVVFVYSMEVSSMRITVFNYNHEAYPQSWSSSDDSAVDVPSHSQSMPSSPSAKNVLL